MKRKPIGLLAGCFVVGSLAGGTFAAEDAAAVDPNKKPTAVQTDQNQNGDKSDKKTQASNLQLMRASQLLDRDVKNEAGESIGEIEDIVIDSKKGQIAYAVLEFGGVLGLGEKQFAIPFRALQEDAARKNLILNVKKEKLEAARGFESDKWPDMADEAWARDTHKHYGVDAYWEDDNIGRKAGDAAVKPGDVKPADGSKQTLRPELNRQHFWVNRVSKIIGTDVQNSAGEELGEVKDLMIDMKHGRIAYAIVTDGGTLGISETLSAVPFGALQAVAAEEEFTLNTTKEALKAKGFKESAWPNMADEHWARQTHEGFKQEPYWSVYGFAGDDLDANWRQGSDYNKAFDATKSRTIKGKVTSVSEYAPAKDSAKGRLVVITTDAGETYSVHMGPVSYLDRKDNAIMIKEGDTITVVGAMGTFEGGQAIQARTIRTESGKSYELYDSQGRAQWERNATDNTKNRENKGTGTDLPRPGTDSPSNPRQ